MPELKNDRLLRAARRQPVDRTPVWIMRQAGRYLPEYRALRAEDEFFTVCRTPELAAEVTLQPIRRFDLDAAIIFSDILVVPQAMGMEVQMIKGRGPVFPEPLGSPGDLDKLRDPDVDDALGYVSDAIRLVVRELDGSIPLLGFCGAPWTIMAYMIEGGGSKTFSKSRTWLFAEPDASKRLLERIADLSIEYLSRQIDAGVSAVQVFDSWAGMLGHREFEEFARPAMRRIVRAVKARHPDVPVIGFAKGAPLALPGLAADGFDVLGLDWSMDPEWARGITGESVALQGNLDPAALFAPPSVIRDRVEEMLKSFGPIGHIANLGHGMQPDHDPDHARAFIDAVHEISERQLSQAALT
jgi:uroporphyrinogen decarboxylase